MSEFQLDGYQGPALPEDVSSLFAILARYGFIPRASTDYSGKTISLFRDDKRFGFVDTRIIQQRAALGYHFAPFGSAKNSCPTELVDSLIPDFCKRYLCQPADISVREGRGSNGHRIFLNINNPRVALRVVLQDAGLQCDESIQITKRRGLYVEGAVFDVIMQGHERSAAARDACLEEYGYDCFVCGINLKSRYVGLLKEVIHVHHEEPIATATGPREVDPITEMKPVCPNCHAVIHSKTPAYSIAEVKLMLKADPND